MEFQFLWHEALTLNYFMFYRVESESLYEICSAADFNMNLKIATFEDDIHYKYILIIFVRRAKKFWVGGISKM